MADTGAGTMARRGRIGIFSHRARRGAGGHPAGSGTPPFGTTPAAFVIGLALIGLGGPPLSAGVLPKEDFERVTSIKTNFTQTIVGLSESLRQPDLAEGERDCMSTISQDLIQIGQELSGYEALMKIESQLNTYSDEGTTREIVIFALNKALDVLNAERRRLLQPPDQCARLPISSGKAKSVLQMIETTITTLQSVLSRL